MFPLHDNTPRRTFPIVNYLLIAVNIYIFYLQLTALSYESFTNRYAFIPSVFNFLDPNSYFYILASLFLHGGLFHIATNMWFLHIFGDNVEDMLGHFRYLLFYLAGGIVAVFAQYFIDPASTIPMIGASGAISAVAGAYFVLFKRSTIRTLIPIFIFWDIIDLPARFFLGYWFFVQIFSGLGSIVSSDINRGGVAFFAHIGGFLFGYLTSKYSRVLNY